MRKLNVLFYHAGADCLATYFKSEDHNVIDITIDIDNKNIPFYDIETGWDFEALYEEYGPIDVLLGNPNCKSYSNNGIAYHRRRPKGKGTKWIAYTHLAKISDKWNKDFIKLIEFLNPPVYVIENPRGHLAKKNFMEVLPRYNITYFSYDPTRYKPTTIFTNIPDPGFLPAATLKDIKGYKIQNVKYLAAKNSSKLPDKLVKHIYNISVKTV